MAEGLLTVGAGGLTGRLVLTLREGGPLCPQLHAVDDSLSPMTMWLTSPPQKLSLL